MTDIEVPRYSASQINTFDAANRFGCNRKWFLKYVEKLESPEPPTRAVALGLEVHRVLEAHYAQTVCPDVSEDAKRISMLAPSIDGVVAVEEPFEHQLSAWGGAWVTGRIDLVTRRGVVDWKTVDTLARAMTPEALANDLQATLYAYHWLQNTTATVCEVCWVYLPTKSSRSAEARIVKAYLTAADVAQNLARFGGLIAEMEATRLKTFHDVPPSYAKCRFCPYSGVCAARTIEQAFSDVKGEVKTMAIETNTEQSTEVSVRERSVLVGWTLNLGDYNSLRVEFGLTGTGDLESEVLKRITTLAERAVAERAKFSNPKK